MKFLIICAIYLFTLDLSIAQTNYPELMVAPRASERLKREAKLDIKGSFMTHLPIQLSGLMTLGAGLVGQSNLDTKKDENGVGPRLAIAVGGAWILTTAYLQATHRPYLKGYNEFKKMPYQATRDQLAAERMAEEHIDDAARIATKLKWLAFTSNFIASAYATDSSKKDSASIGLGYVGILSSFLPLLFPYRAVQVSEDQRSYKKKIFGPITFGQGILTPPAQSGIVPGILVTTTF